jgi:hypothetical protein
MIHSGNATVQRREERLLRQRLQEVDAKVDRALVMAREAAKAPLFTDDDIAEVGRLLVEGKVRLPPHVRVTVTTTVEDVRHELFNTSSQVIKHEADQIHTKLLRPMTILEALEAGLLVRLAGTQGRGSNWFWAQAAYELAADQ